MKIIEGKFKTKGDEKVAIIMEDLIILLLID